MLLIGPFGVCFAFSPVNGIFLSLSQTIFMLWSYSRITDPMATWAVATYYVGRTQCVRATLGPVWVPLGVTPCDTFQV